MNFNLQGESFQKHEFRLICTNVGGGERDERIPPLDTKGHHQQVM